MKLHYQMLLVLGFLTFAPLLNAQTGTITMELAKGPVTLSDTVSAGQLICLDSSVTSFVVDMNVNGQLISTRYTGNCFTLQKGLRSGTKLYVSQIIAEQTPGTKVKMPGRQFYVR